MHVSLFSFIFALWFIGLRIGKGEGYADLEFAMMAANGAVDEHTVVVSTVHDCQVLPLPEPLFKPHDVPVDYIVTPTRVIQCKPRPKPKGIMWQMLTPAKFHSIPILKRMRSQDHMEGKDVRLADGSDFQKRSPAKQQPSAKRIRDGVDRVNSNQHEVDGEAKEVNMNGNPLESGPRPESAGEKQKKEEKKVDKVSGMVEKEKASGMDAVEEKKNVEGAKPVAPPQTSEPSMVESQDAHKPQHGEAKPPSLQTTKKDPALIIGDIPRGTRVSTVKSKIRERGVSLLRGFSLGGRSFLCLFKTDADLEEALVKLEGLELEGHSLRVEKAGQQSEKPPPVNVPAKKQVDSDSRPFDMKRLFLGGLPPRMYHNQLARALREIDVYPSHITLLRGRAFGFLSFESEADTSGSLEKLEGFSLRQYNIRAARAYEKKLPADGASSGASASHVEKASKKESSDDVTGMSDADDTTPEKQPRKKTQRRLRRSHKVTSKEGESSASDPPADPSERRYRRRHRKRMESEDHDAADEDHAGGSYPREPTITLPAIRIYSVPRGTRIRPLKDILRERLGSELFSFIWWGYRRQAVAVMPPDFEMHNLDDLQVNNQPLKAVPSTWNVVPSRMGKYHRRILGRSRFGAADGAQSKDEASLGDVAPSKSESDQVVKGQQPRPQIDDGKSKSDGPEDADKASPEKEAPTEPETCLGSGDEQQGAVNGGADPEEDGVLPKQPKEDGNKAPEKHKESDSKSSAADDAPLTKPSAEAHGEESAAKEVVDTEQQSSTKAPDVAQNIESSGEPASPSRSLPESAPQESKGPVKADDVSVKNQVETPELTVDQQDATLPKELQSGSPK